MPRLSFDQLLEIYKATAFDADGRSGALRIPNDQVLATLRFLDADEDAAHESGIGLGAADPESLVVGQKVDLEFTAPRLGLGVLVNDFSALLGSAGAMIEEPRAYYVIEGAHFRGGSTPPEFARYRKVLQLVGILTESAAYLDRLKQELVFVRETKLAVPVRYDLQALTAFSLIEADRLLGLLSDEAHKDQKLEILSEALVRLCEPLPTHGRFKAILQNLDVLADAVRDGYKLFASSFSYAKIRGELENAKIDYITKIHRTIVDIQTQLLGIPVATIIVASQLKSAQVCGVELWTDVAVLSGAWVFLALLLIALLNQWLTLDAIASEIARQKTKLARDYADLGSQFTSVFDNLGGRILGHRFALGIIALIALTGAVFATVSFDRVVSVDVGSCLTGKVPMVTQKL